MKTKRFLALILSVALLATSADFSLLASAREDAAESVWDDAQTFYESTTDDGDGEETTGEFDDETTGEFEDEPDPSKIIYRDDYFEVDGVGTLHLIDGVTLKSTVEIPAEAVKIPAGIFKNNSVIKIVRFQEGSKLEVIGASAFERSTIQSIVFPSELTLIDKAAFKGCEKLTTVGFAANGQLETIGEDAFRETGLTMVVLPVSVSAVGNFAFYKCPSLIDVTFKKVETIGESAFEDCVKLKTVAWGDSIQAIGSFAFRNTAIQQLVWNSGTNLTTFAQDIDWGIKVFADCKSLTKVNFNDAMTEIPEGMFYGCKALSTVTFPKKCEEIKKSAFENCTSLKSVTIGEKISRIYSDAFAGCSALTSAEIQQRNSATGVSDVVIDPTAFPKKEMTMRGYDGSVEEYAGNRSYKFKTLAAEYTISKDVQTKYGSVEISVGDKKLTSDAKVAPGAIVTVKVTPKEYNEETKEHTYRLKADAFYYHSKLYGDVDITDLKEEADKYKTFTFVMPDDDITVNVEFEKTSVSYGRLIATFEQVDDQMIPHWDYDEDDKPEKDEGKRYLEPLVLDKTGYACQLVMKGYNTSKKEAKLVGNWNFKFESSDTSVVVIDEKGYIYARGLGKSGKGQAKITATLKGSSSKIVFPVEVSQDVDYKNIQVSLNYSNLRQAKLSSETIGDTTYTVITYSKAQLASAEKTFNVSFTAREGKEAANLRLYSTWEVSNTNLAAVENEKVNNNTNTVTVKKGEAGETAVTVTVTNGKTDKKDKIEVYKESFILRIEDTTPRLLDSKVTLNTQCDSGTKVNLLFVYGCEIDAERCGPDDLKLVQAEKKGGMTIYSDFELAEIRYDEMRSEFIVYLTADGWRELNAKSTLTYSKVYIQGYQLTEDGASVDFQVPIKSLVLTSKDPAPSIKFTGKVNLFYNNLADPDVSGKAVMTQSLTDLSVESYELISAANHDRAGSETPDSFANNFNIDSKGVITRSSNALMYDEKNKPVCSGYVRIKYAGYMPCDYKITVPTQNVKPNYILSSTKATLNSESKGYKIEFQLLDKKTKKPVSLANLDRLTFDAEKTTTGMFEKMNVEDAKSTDTITLQIKAVDGAKKGKAVINVDMYEWSEALSFTYNVSFSSAAPKVKLKNSTLVLNNLCPGQPAVTQATLNQMDVVLDDLDNDGFVGSASLEAEAAGIDISYEDGELKAVADGEVKPGSYKFRLIPYIVYTSGGRDELKPITVTVKVIRSNLAVAMKPSSVTLNDSYAGSETFFATYTIKNLPAGSSGIADASSMDIEPLNDASDLVQDAFDFKFSETENEFSVSQTAALGKAGSYKYRITGLRANGVEITTPLNVTVKVIKKQATLSVKANGCINPCNQSEGLKYLFTTKNLSANIEDVLLKEIDTKNKNAEYDEPEHFQIHDYICDSKGRIIGVELRAKEDVVFDAKTTYKVKLGIVLDGGESKEVWMSSYVKVKLTQILPKVTADVTSTTMYVGAPVTSSLRNQDIVITKTTLKDARIEKVIVSKKNSENLREAFAVEFDEETQTATLTLLRPDMIQANKEYSVKLEALLAGQMENTYGSMIAIKVKINN